jgi:cobalt-zinc-cadmium efflux system outer membrane protein
MPVLHAVLCRGAISLWLCGSLSAGQPAHAQAEDPALRLAWASAWAQHPPAQALPWQRLATEAQSEAAQRWTAQPPTLDLRRQSDRPGSGQGAREWELGLSWPLWRPGERAHSQQAAAAEALTLVHGEAALKLALAAQLREAWWAWQRQRAEAELAHDRVVQAQVLATDVQRRVQAGDLARADAHQAEGHLADSEAAHAQAQARLSLARQAVQALVGGETLAEGLDETAGRSVGEWRAQPPASVAPAPLEPDLAPEAHPLWQALHSQAQAAENQAALQATQASAPMELSLSTVQGRTPGEPAQRALVLGLRLPLGSRPEAWVQAAQAHAQASELQARLGLLRQHLLLSWQGAQVRLRLAESQLRAASQRSRLAEETQVFFQKAFALGEADLPTRLRIGNETQEARRQATLALIDLQAARSALLQAAGRWPQ